MMNWKDQSGLRHPYDGNPYGTPPTTAPRAYPAQQGGLFESLRQSMESVRFHMSRWHGYEVTDVDNFVDRLLNIVSGRDSPQTRQALVRELTQVRFHMSRRRGYEVTDVDNFLDQVLRAVS